MQIELHKFLDLMNDKIKHFQPFIYFIFNRNKILTEASINFKIAISLASPSHCRWIIDFKRFSEFSRNVAVLHNIEHRDNAFQQWENFV